MRTKPVSFFDLARVYRGPCRTPKDKPSCSRFRARRRARKALDELIRAARAALLRLQAEYGLGAFVQLEGETGAVTFRSLKKVQASLARTVRSALQRLKSLQAKRAKLPTRVPVRQAVREETRCMAPELQHLMNLIKMVAYQAESDLVAMIQPHYRRASQDGRTPIQSALAGAPIWL